MEEINICECPRDAMQGITQFIPTEKKINYINTLLKVGFNKIDFGSFVSPKAIPQLSDTAKVIDGLDLSNTNSKLLAIIANKRGAIEASQYEHISYLGFPFSISEEFQKRNTNASLSDAYERILQINEICSKKNKSLQIYLSMGFGNPYGEPWSAEIALFWIDKLYSIGIKDIALSDTIGVSTPSSIRELFTQIINDKPDVNFIAHLHSNPNTAMEKIRTAYISGCRNFDSAINGYGGCPMAKDELTGNIATQKIFDFIKVEGISHHYNESAFQHAIKDSQIVF